MKSPLLVTLLWLLTAVSTDAQLLKNNDGARSTVSQSGRTALGAVFSDGYREYEEPIDPELYLVRPGDSFKLVFIGTLLPVDTVVVDPEGNIVRASLGVLKIAGMSLQQAKLILEEQLHKVYKFEHMAVSVLRPRRLAISVSGAVNNPGTVVAWSSQRVSEIIDLAGGVTAQGSTRRIILSGGPQEISVDLEKAASSGDKKSNPSIYAGTQIFVPNRQTATVYVAGEVNRPRQVELMDDDDLSLLLFLAGGTTLNADTSSIRVNRMGEEFSAYGTEFQAGDIIHVPALPYTVDLLPVVVCGAVNRPTAIPYRSDLTVEAVLEQAGGYQLFALKARTTVFRRILWPAQVRQPVPVPLALTHSDNGEFDQTPLLPGDSVFVPHRFGFVRVLGEVARPGYFAYSSGKTCRDYIRLAGGYLKSANRNEVDLFDAVTGVTAIVNSETRVRDGDEITVSAEGDNR